MLDHICESICPFHSFESLGALGEGPRYFWWETAGDSRGVFLIGDKNGLFFLFWMKLVWKIVKFYSQSFKSTANGYRQTTIHNVENIEVNGEKKSVIRKFDPFFRHSKESSCDHSNQCGWIDNSREK